MSGTQQIDIYRQPIQMEKQRELFREFLSKRGLKVTSQRDLIFDVFFRTHSHVNVEELYALVRRQDPRVGYATVYRTLKLLVESGLASSRNFGDGHTRYERGHDEAEHHDHLICISCGKIVEFKNKKIETLQKMVATKHQFKIEKHKLEIYGYCKDCR